VSEPNFVPQSYTSGLFFVSEMQKFDELLYRYSVANNFSGGGRLRLQQAGRDRCLAKSFILSGAGRGKYNPAHVRCEMAILQERSS
jgi:hypothetical protein